MEAKERFLTPGALRPIQSLQPKVSRRTSQTIMWAMALHPDDRPSSVAEFRRALLGKEPMPSARGKPDRAGWKDAVHETRWMALVVALLALAAVLATLLAPYHPVF